MTRGTTRLLGAVTTVALGAGALVGLTSAGAGAVDPVPVRVVCDATGPSVTDATASCASAGLPATRSEGDPPTGDAEVDGVWDLTGGFSSLYFAATGGDLTAVVGLDLAGTPTIASTVHTADPDSFWDGDQARYAPGQATVDDLVGRVLTLGVLDGRGLTLGSAVAQSYADVMGEIFDHRTVSAGDDAASWEIGEDLTGGALRSLSDPTLHDQADSLTSPLYAGASGAVRSGVGNKTFFLISQGGTFGGRSVTGIDAGDPTLAASTALYGRALGLLPADAGYPELATALEQACAALVTSSDLVAADCDSVADALLATGLRTPPPIVVTVQNLSRPTVSGTARVGRTLSAVPGSWSPAGVSFDFRWLRDGRPIAGASKRTYELTPRDAGAQVAVRVTGTRGAATPVVARSAAVSVRKGRLVASRPFVLGHTIVGDRLVAQPGAWRPGTVRFRYQWLRDGAEIRGATGHAYRLRPADFRARIQVRVTGRKKGFTKVTRTSRRTDPVRRPQ